LTGAGLMIFFIPTGLAGEKNRKRKGKMLFSTFDEISPTIT